MQNNGVLKLGLVVLLATSLVACQQTKNTPPPETAKAAPAPAPAAPAPRPTNNGPTPEELKRQAALAMTVFYFDFDKSDLRQESKDALVYHAADLKQKGTKIRLEGHADERGTREYNLALGERRAKSVLNFLQVNGVAPSQMETISYGEERPADPAKSEAAYQRNRRVEMKK